MARPDKRNAYRQPMAAAARYRERAASGANPDASVLWTCTCGHAWDASPESAQNVRCMNCALQRRDAATRRLRDMAQARGGVLLSPCYVDDATPLQWQCAFGHVWSARAELAPRVWCTECARRMFSRYR
ncbi:hypothetical protein QCE62_02535 [Caballeronia sp. LZ033]|uniref:hypothetical protein n=1 Tax=Caballeronia sp. LZ033 TaxID=3038566 RepID=UPI00285EE3FE|nr:hypothetical protein [Caballeronia sp. LZ033]MDR5812467.1 hypothetical protein [Caballeronia sp. LZ033]